jgi:hypothetical protein
MIPSAQPILRSLQIARDRDVLPTDLSSGELAELAKRLWEQCFFSARTTNAEYAAALKELVDRYIAGGYNSDFDKLKLEAQALLRKHGYTPEGGFGDGKVPAAEEGSLQDLSSEKRLRLIFDTNRQLAAGLAQKEGGLTKVALSAFPAWELLRVEHRRVPRGSVKNGSPGWEKRWVQVGGSLVGDYRMIALKTSDIWEKIGSRAYFDDALDVDHPPFAFNSGFGWRAVDRAEAIALLGEGPVLAQVNAQRAKDELAPLPSLPKSLDPTTKAALIEKLKALRPGSISGGDLGRMALEAQRRAA